MNVFTKSEYEILQQRAWPTNNDRSLLNLKPIIHKLCRVKLFKINVKVKVKCSRYRPGVAQRVGRVIALLFHDRGTRRG